MTTRPLNRPYPKGIRKTKTGYEVFARRDGKWKSKHFTGERDISFLTREREKLVGRLVDPDAYPEPGAKTFAQDAAEYLKLVAGMITYKDRMYRIARWVEVFGPRARTSLTAREIAAQLETWRKTGAADGGPLSPGSLNLRRTALLHLFTRLDGKSGKNPVLDVPPYDERDSMKARAVPLLTIAKLIRHLRYWGKMRARLHVLMWTGWPHALLKGVTAEDIDWDRARVRLGRRKKGKGMPAAWVPVMPRGMIGLRRMAELRAFGEFSNSAMHSALARAVAIENAKPERKHRPLSPVNGYQLRHSFATWAASVIKDDRALKELLRTNSIARYTEGATADRLESARAQLTLAARRS